MAHANARLTVYSRLALVERVLIEGWPASEVARHFQVSRSTAYKWVRRYRTEGEAGLLDRSSRPHRRPRALDQPAIEAILAARRYRRYSPHRLAPVTGHPRSTIYGVLRRHRVNRLDGLDRLTGRPVRRRYVAAYPGALVHEDSKPLVRVPGLPTTRRGVHPGHDQLEVFVDDHSRLACVVVSRSGGAIDTVRALDVALRWFAAHGIAVERILTDNGSSYCSKAYAAPPGRARHPPQPDPHPAAPDQRHGRALHRDAPNRVGLRPAVPDEPRPPPPPRPLPGLLQSAPAPHRARRPVAARRAVRNVSGNDTNGYRGPSLPVGSGLTLRGWEFGHNGGLAVPPQAPTPARPASRPPGPIAAPPR